MKLRDKKGRFISKHHAYHAWLLSEIRAGRIQTDYHIILWQMDNNNYFMTRADFIPMSTNFIFPYLAGTFKQIKDIGIVRPISDIEVDT